MASSSIFKGAFRTTQSRSYSTQLKPELINYVRKLRTENPRRWTPQQIHKKFNIPLNQVDVITPKYVLKEKAREDFLKDRRSKVIKEAKEVKNERLLNWWKVQIENIPKYREIRKEYVRRRGRVIEEVDVALWESSDLRDEKADIAAEKIRNEKRRMFSKKRK